MAVNNQQHLRFTLMAARIFVAFIVLAFVAMLVVTLAKDESILEVLPAALLFLAAVVSIIPAGMDAANKLKAQAN